MYMLNYLRKIFDDKKLVIKSGARLEHHVLIKNDQENLEEIEMDQHCVFSALGYNL